MTPEPSRTTPMQAFVRRFLRRQEGAALVEFAVILPLIVVILLVIVDLARFVAAGIGVSNAARAGAQYGAYSLSFAADTIRIRRAAQHDYGADSAKLRLDSLVLRCYCPDAPNTTVGCTSTCAAGGYGMPEAHVTVAARRSLRPLIRLPGMPDSIRIRRIAKIRVR